MTKPSFIADLFSLTIIKQRGRNWPRHFDIVKIVCADCSHQPSIYPLDSIVDTRNQTALETEHNERVLIIEPAWQAVSTVRLVDQRSKILTNHA